MASTIKLVKGRLVQHQQERDLDTQTIHLRVISRGVPCAQVVAEARAAQAHDTDQIVKAIKEQEYYRLNEQDDLVRRSHRANGWCDTVNQQYKHGLV